MRKGIDAFRKRLESLMNGRAMLDQYKVPHGPAQTTALLELQCEIWLELLDALTKEDTCNQPERTSYVPRWDRGVSDVAMGEIRGVGVAGRDLRGFGARGDVGATVRLSPVPNPPGDMYVDPNYPGDEVLATQLFLVHKDLLRQWTSDETLATMNSAARENIVGTWFSISEDARTTYRMMAYVVWSKGYRLVKE